jgi:hypothetical protein
VSKTEDIAIPKELIEAVLKGECILFVASGLSSAIQRTSGKNLPSWKDFLMELLQWCIQNNIQFNSEPLEIKAMIDKGNFLMAALARTSSCH